MVCLGSATHLVLRGAAARLVEETDEAEAARHQQQQRPDPRLPQTRPAVRPGHPVLPDISVRLLCTTNVPFVYTLPLQVVYHCTSCNDNNSEEIALQALNGTAAQGPPHLKQRPREDTYTRQHRRMLFSQI